MQNLNTRRLFISIITGAILGIFCIIGVSLRMGLEGNALFLIATWYNRLILGLVIGLAAGLEITKDSRNVFIRGLILGAVVSFALFLSTGFKDIPGFFAGVFYGVIIDYLASRFE